MVAAEDVIAQVVAAKDVIAQVVVARVGLLLLGDLQEVQELVLSQKVLAQVHQIAMCHKPARQVELVLAKTVLAQVCQIAMCLSSK